ncbi:phage tail tip lysozyme [Bombilactobacillus folatiphilus]|uniref:Phage tail tip lysozyme n=1 Tax=Bombilactobacillus folatiphilus TaxID=2923362 RepID=A0ABY4P8W3_9LACO|nr:phage tail tip lysozyme [Bombilactobacillus folatiphilus]UQS81961.1 phage tail tip lysozyme [Bombilactobacillus folatiphilus]
MEKKRSAHPIRKRHFQTSIMPKLSSKTLVSQPTKTPKQHIPSAQSIYRTSNLIYSADYQVDQIKVAQQVYVNLTKLGWSLNAIAGVLGNMAVESQLRVDFQGHGYGLLSWPVKELATWCQESSLNYQNVLGQCTYLNEELTKDIHFQETEHFQINGLQYLQSQARPQILAEVFAQNYAHLNAKVQLQRGTQAQFWYHFLQDPTKNLAQPARQYTLQHTTPIRLQPKLTGMIIGQYAAGEKVTYMTTQKIQGQTWLMYYNACGQSCYLAVPDGAADNQELTPQKVNTTQQYLLQNDTLVYEMPDPKSVTVGTLTSGKVITYEQRVTNDWGVWLAYRAASQQLRYFLIENADKKARLLDNQYEITYPMPVYSRPDHHFETIGQLPAETTITYQRRFYQNSCWWLEYQSASGQLCYLMVAHDQSEPADQTYVVSSLTSIRLTPSLQGKIIGHYNPGETVHYFKQLHVEGYAWLALRTSTEAVHYIAKLN